MRRTVRALMASTMPSLTAWRARSALLQCVRCSPRAIGSRQANWTSWARCRGGKLLGPSQAGLVQQQGGQAALLIAAADAPDGGPVTLQAGGHRLDGFARRDGEHDAGMLDLEGSEVAAAGHGSQDRIIGVGDGQGTRLSAAHGSTSAAGA